MTKHILITGVGRGFGKALALEFLKRGYKVFGVLRNALQIADLRHALFTPVLCDLSQDDCVDVIKKTVGEVPVSLLINNAGISGICSDIKKVQVSDVLRVLNVHCGGAIRVSGALATNLEAAENAAVINITSRMGSVENQMTGTYEHLTSSYEYRIAKAALNMFGACLKDQFGDKLGVFQVHPGRMITGMSQKDAHMRPEESAIRLSDAWEQKRLVEGRGIHDLETGEVYPW